jgi:hypothetical protein
VPHPINRRGFAAASHTLALAIGIGATSTMFGLALTTKFDVCGGPLPVAHPRQLVALARTGPPGTSTLSFTAAEIWPRSKRALAAGAQLTLTPAMKITWWCVVTRDDEHVCRRDLRTSSSFFPTLA